MPLGPIAEFILQPIAELVIQLIGYFTGRIIVPAFTLGKVYVEPGPDKKFVVPKFGRIQRLNGRLIMDAELGAFIGIVFWFITVIGAFAYFNNT